MKIVSGKLVVAAAFCLALVAQTRPLVADERIPCERRLPANVLGFVSLRNIADFKAGWGKTLYGRLGSDEALGDFRAGLEKQFDELSRQIEDQIGLGLSELLSIPQGEIAAAAMASPDGTLGFVAFLDFGDRKESVEKLLEKASEELDRHHARRTEDEIDDTRVVTIEIEDDADDDDQGASPLPDTLSYFVKDSFLVLANSTEPLKEVLSRWDGKQEQALADNEVFRYIVERCREGEAAPQLTWFIDPMAAVQAFVQLGAAQLPQVDEGLATLRNLGIDKFRGLGGTFDMARGDFDMVSRGLVYLEPPAKGVLELLRFDVTHQSPPKWLSSEWTGYTGINWSLARTYATIEALVDLRQGPGFLAAMVDNLAANEMFGKIHLKKDIFDQFAGPIHIAQDDSVIGDEGSTGVLIAAPIRKPAAFRATLQKVVRLAGGALKLEEREFQGETIYDIEIPQIASPYAAADGDDDDENENVPAAPKHVGLAVAEDSLMFATDIRLLERVLRGMKDREALADSASYNRVSRKFPAQTASIGYSRQDAQVKVLYDLLKSGKMGPLFVKLPDFDALKKYMPESGSFTEQDERGLRMTSFSLAKDTD